MTKGVAAAAVHYLVDQGLVDLQVRRWPAWKCVSCTEGPSHPGTPTPVPTLVDLQAPVCTYWPAFAAHGKQGVTVAHVLTHQAGLSNACLDDLADDPFLASDR